MKTNEEGSSTTEQAKQHKRMRAALDELVDSILCYRGAGASDATGWDFPDGDIHLDELRNAISINVNRRRVSFTP